jgi:signal transduction histidine kinase/CheY-like chemotaxis protein
MNEIEAIKSELGRYQAILARQIDRLYNALEELQRTTLLLTDLDPASPEEIAAWLRSEGFSVDEDGFFQSEPLVAAFRDGRAPDDAVSFSWGSHLKDDPSAARDLYRHRHIGYHLKHIRDHLGDIGWIYYQNVHNVALQYPYIDQRTAIPSDFDWSTYHTYVSVSPGNNPQRQIAWTPPTIDYAGEGLIAGVSIPVWRGDEFLGLWSIDLPLRYLYRDFSLSKTHPDQSQFIVNREGLLLLHEKLNAEIDQTQGRIFLHPLSELGGQWTDLDVDTILSKKANPFTVIDGKGNEWLFCFAHMPGVEWTLFSGLPRSSMEEASTQRLKQAFEQIAAGNFTHRIEPAQGNALAILVEAFNEMSQRLGEVEKNRERAEQQLLQARKLEAVGRLAGGVAHDYNNITNVIMGYSEMALRKLKGDDPLHRYVKEIREAAQRSADLTRQLLTFARCQSVSPKVLDINRTVDGILKMLNRMVGEDIQILWRPGREIWPIEIDPSQIDQILANLCINSRDAISSVGKIVIETANVEFGRHDCAVHRGCLPGEFVQLTVTDDGQGMDRETMENIFEPFFSTKPVGSGTGLGLSTVYGIVKQNGGFINVYSEPGNGACFKLFLPRAEGKTVGTVASHPSEIPRGRNETLLLVEDEPALLALVEQMLRELGYRVLATTSPDEALELARTHLTEIDLLVTDVIMPHTTGRDLSVRIQALLPDAGTLFMSGYSAEVISQRGVLEQGIVIAQKPFSKNELAIKVRTVLDSKARKRNSPA